ncbi:MULTISPECIES: hypothetical protein [unclassified Acinetobacter]|uniref:hypothetical protein n=1 Tax=unclassified Acinetobacter TaxID=196816 RepID=UPI0015D1E738|nr:MULTISPECIES: hypothetical protein [unclassified Acinetobacter]
MKLELNVPDDFPRQLIDLFHGLHPRLPKGYPTECISLDKAIGRRVAENVIASNNYPAKNLSKFAGWGINSHMTQNIKANNFLKINNMYFWDAELYRSKDIYKIDYKEDSIIRLPKNIELPCEIDAVIQEDDSRLDLEDPFSYKVLSPIEKFEGVIKQGSIIQQGECLVQKNEKINAEKVIVLSRAGLREIEVYKKPKIIIVSMYNYDTEEKISEECIYVQNILQQWGYDDVGVKILKPIRLEHAFKIETEQKNPIINPALTSSQERFTDEFHVLTAEYDLILVCSASSSSGGILTLPKLATFDQSSTNTPINMLTLNEEKFKVFRSDHRSHPINKTEKILDTQGNYRGLKTHTIEDKATIVNLLGDVDDIAMTINVGVRYILNRTDPNFIKNNFHRGFIKNYKTNDKMQLLFGNYTQDDSGKFLIDIDKNLGNHPLNKFMHSNCIVIIPSKHQIQVDIAEIFFIRLY